MTVKWSNMLTIFHLDNYFNKVDMMMLSYWENWIIKSVSRVPRGHVTSCIKGPYNLINYKSITKNHSKSVGMYP
jgi:hypothetical protein